MLKSKHYPDFSLNPHNVKIGDWVFARGNVGKIIDIHVNNGKMLQFWVNWGASNIPRPELANNLQKVNKPMAISDSIREVPRTIKLTLLTIDTNLQQRVEINDSVVDDYAQAYSLCVELPPITVWREEGSGEKGVGSSEQVGSGEQGVGSSEQVGSSDNNQVIDSHNSELTSTADSLVTESSRSMVTESSQSTLPIARYYLVDGFHRVAAAKQAGITELPFIEKSGTYREALLFSLGVNSTHGLRRSNADKRKAVMTLLQDSEWGTWSDNAIAKKTSTSQPFVSKLRKDILNLDTIVDNSNLTNNIISGNQGNNNSNLTDNIITGNHESNEEVTRTYITKDGIEAKMRVGNIGKGKSSESFPPVEDNQIISEQLKEDEVKEEENTTPHSPLPTPLVTTAELIDFTNVKPTKGKQKITNPLSVGDRVKVKDNHYFGGREGNVTQISSPYSLVVAFDNDQREFFRLEDLDLPTILSQPQKPQKKEILIKEGLNYKAGQGCKWYIEVEEEDYRLFQEYQRQVNAPTIRSCLVRAVEVQKQEKSPIKTDDLLINLSSKISYLNKQQRLFLAKQLLECDPDILNQLINQQHGQ